jgi:hypothetical protein
MNLQVIDVRATPVTSDPRAHVDASTAVLEVVALQRIQPHGFRSVLLRLRGFRAYVHFPVTPQFTATDATALAEHLQQDIVNTLELDPVENDRMVHIELVQDEREPLMFYRPESGDRYRYFVKVFVQVCFITRILFVHFCSIRLT